MQVNVAAPVVIAAPFFVAAPLVGATTHGTHKGCRYKDSPVVNVVASLVDAIRPHHPWHPQGVPLHIFRFSPCCVN